MWQSPAIKIPAARFLTALGLMGLFVFLAVSQIQAQSINSLSLTVNPPVEYITLKPGERHQHQITITYEGGTPVTVTPTLVNFNPAASGQGIELEEKHTFPYLDPNEPNPFQQAVTLEPGRPTTFTLPIAVPSSAATREYHLTVLFTANPSQNIALGSSQTSVAGTIGSNVIVLVQPDSRDLSQLSIKNVQGSTLIDSFGHINLRFMTNNSGLTATVASGSAVVRDGRGQVVKTYDIYPDVILANSNRLLRVVNPDGESETKNPEPLSGITYKAPFLIGKYTIEIILLDQNGNERVSHAANVWAVPFTILIVVIISTFAIIGYKLYISKKFRRIKIFD